MFGAGNGLKTKIIIFPDARLLYHCVPEKEDHLMIRRRKVDDRIWRANNEREIVASEPKIAFRCNNG